MFDLTPGERRGAFMLLGLCALGAVWDLIAPAGFAPGISEPLVSSAPAPVPSAPVASAAAAAAPLDLNTAGLQDLDNLPGIGPVLAHRILEHRARFGPFRSTDELRTVQGIGPRLLERLRPLVRAGGTPPGGVQVARPAQR
jgi:competence ComEA-like helix-hairpin-helix protein